MNVWVVLISMAAGAAISEVYNARIRKSYREGRREGREAMGVRR
jgi:hypothetical protein